MYWLLGALAVSPARDPTCRDLGRRYIGRQGAAGEKGGDKVVGDERKTAQLEVVYTVYMVQDVVNVGVWSSAEPQSLTCHCLSVDLNDN